MTHVPHVSAARRKRILVFGLVAAAVALILTAVGSQSAYAAEPLPLCAAVACGHNPIWAIE